MPLPTDHILFQHWEKTIWLQQIEKIYLTYSDAMPPRTIRFSFADEFVREKIEPIHLVTYACLIQYLNDKGHTAAQGSENSEIFNYIFKELNFRSYWHGIKNHVNTANADRIFNLWRIVEAEKDLYAKNVEAYFKRRYFANKDLSSISISLVEAF